eukprot:Filipodium_phascolosomae@DN1589_c0_g1_i1.p1
MHILASYRMKLMKSLYRQDFEIYKDVCEDLKIKMIRFAIPGSQNPSKASNKWAVDGDRCKYLIRQKVFARRYRPRPVLVDRANSFAVRYKRYPYEAPPDDWNQPRKVRQRVSRLWPYGVQQQRVLGQYVVHDPTAPGPGYCPAEPFISRP